MIDLDNFESACKIKIVGVGGAGINSINSMCDDNIFGAEFYAIDTDSQKLSCSPCPNRIILGEKLIKGLGSGYSMELASQAVQESEKEIKEALKGANIVFLNAGMGRGTGSGALPTIAKIAKELNALVIAIVYRPFSFEGPARMSIANTGIENLRQYADSVITISNDRVMQLSGNIPLDEAFNKANQVLFTAVNAITDLISIPAMINLDFADVNSLLKEKGTAMIGYGVGKGDNKLQDAVSNAMFAPYIEHSINGARSAIVSIVGSKITPYDCKDIVEAIRKVTTSDLNIIFGASINEEMDDEIHVTIIANDFPSEIDDSNVKQFTDIFNKQSNSENDEELTETDETGSIFFRKKKK